MADRDVIPIEPGRRSGKPCIRGLRITVTDVWEYWAAGMTEAEILSDFAEWEERDIRGEFLARWCRAYTVCALFL
ncbi:MAG: DUF433 domain-containing protein, partial [Acidobacteriaceae bacterium]|nr:DUF433 domain-containing protein [Acidobacteriaceae bacterium]